MGVDNPTLTHNPTQVIPAPGMVTTTGPMLVRKLQITVVEAKLSRNYGLTRMDPYCRVRVGHSVFETPTCPNGAREPKWNKTFSAFFMPGTKSVEVEVFDECTFSQDALVAHGSFPLEGVESTSNEIIDEWIALSGNEGDGKEGMLKLIMSFHNEVTHPGMVRPGGGHPAAPQARVKLEEVKVIFPNLDDEIIQCVIDAEPPGDKSAVIEKLLEIGQQ